MKNYNILIGAQGSEFPASMTTTEEEMKEFIWELINTGWMRQDGSSYFFLPATRIDYVTVDEGE